MSALETVRLAAVEYLQHYSRRKVLETLNRIPSKAVSLWLSPPPFPKNTESQQNGTQKVLFSQQSNEAPVKCTPAQVQMSKDV
jgi:hypothetical protein